MKLENTQAQMRKGVLELCILSIVRGEGEAYPSDIISKLKESQLIITLSEEEAKHAKSFMRNIFLHNLEYGLPKDSLSDKYDAIICSHVLEHICYP